MSASRPMMETSGQLREEAFRLLVEEPDDEVSTADRDDQLMALTAGIMISLQEFLLRPEALVPCLRAVVERIYRLGYRDGEASERARGMVP